jgi:hypothetical protein
MDDRYRSLRIVATLLRVLAVIVALLGALFVFVGSAMGGLPAGMPGARGPGITVATLVGLVVVALYALFLWAAGAMINLFIDLERNTRATADMIANLGRSTSPPE